MSQDGNKGGEKLACEKGEILLAKKLVHLIPISPCLASQTQRELLSCVPLSWVAIHSLLINFNVSIKDVELWETMGDGAKSLKFKDKGDLFPGGPICRVGDVDVPAH